MIYKYCQIKYAFPNASNIVKYTAKIKMPFHPFLSSSPEETKVLYGWASSSSSLISPFTILAIWGEPLDPAWSSSCPFSLKCKTGSIISARQLALPDLRHSTCVTSHLSSVKLLKIFLMHVDELTPAEESKVMAFRFLGRNCYASIWDQDYQHKR